MAKEKKKMTGEVGGRSGLTKENSQISDREWAGDWNSPMNANNPKDVGIQNNYPKADSTRPSNPMGFTGVSGK